jgi:hypothetical protein
VATRSAGFPDAAVGLTPDRLDVVDDRAPTRPEALLDPADDRRAEERDAEDLAVDVELELFGRGVADADRFRALVAGELLSSNSVRRRSPLIPYMIWIFVGSPVPTRSR